MLGWNRVIKTPGKLQLEIVSSILLHLVLGLQAMCSLTGMGLLLFSFFTFFQKSPFNWLCVIGGALLLVIGNVINIIHNLLKRLSIQYTFDLNAKTLYIEYAQNDYDFLPHSIPFAHIESLRLLILKPQESMARWQLELIMDDGKFYPLTTFKSEKKARHIIKELQQIMNCSFRETAAPDQSFKEYKQLFLNQFKPSS